MVSLGLSDLHLRNGVPEFFVRWSKGRYGRSNLADWDPSAQLPVWAQPPTFNGWNIGRYWTIPTMRCRDSPQWNDYWLMLAPLVWHIHHKPKRICPVMCPATRQTLFSGTNGHHKLSIIISIFHYGHYIPLISHGNPNWWLVKNTLPISSNDLMDFEIYIQYNMLIFMWETQCHNLPFVDGL